MSPCAAAALTWPQVVDHALLGLFILVGLFLVGWFFYVTGKWFC